VTHRFLFAGILVVGALLRLSGLGRESLWQDESWTWYLVHDSLGDLLHRLILSDAHPPLYFLLLWPWVKLGDSETLLRLPSALLGIASLPLLYRLGRSLAGAREGLVAMAFLAVSPFHVMYSQEARSYSLLFFLCLLSLDLLVAVRERPGDRRRWAALAVVTAAIIYTEYLGVFFILGEMALALAWGQRDRGFSRGCLLASAAAFALFIPWIPTAFGHVTHVGQGFWLPKPVPAVLGMELSRMIVYPHGVTATIESAGSPGLAIGVLAAALPAIGMVALGLGAARLSRRPELAPWVWATIVPILTMGVTGFFISIFCARGLIYVLAPLLALAAVGATALPGWTGRLSIAAGLLCALPGLASIHGSLHKENWRAAAGFLRLHVAPGELVIVDEGFLDVNLRYYWRDRGTIEVLPVEGAIEEVVARARGNSRVWVARRVYPERTDPPRVLAGTSLERLWHVRETWRARTDLENRLGSEFPRREEWRWQDVGLLRFSR
jgi:mannosyltransferase